MNEQNYKEVSTIGRWGRMHGRYLEENHPVRYMHHFYKRGLSFASMNSEKTGMKQPSVYLTAKTPLPQYHRQSL